MKKRLADKKPKLTNLEMAAIGFTCLWMVITTVNILLHSYLDSILHHKIMAGLGLVGLLVFGLAVFSFYRIWSRRADDLSKFKFRSDKFKQVIARRTADLHSQQRQVQSFLNNLEAGAYLKNERHEFTMVNPRFCAILGVSSVDILGSTAYSFLPRAIGWRMVEMEQKVVREGKPMDVDNLLESSDKNDTRVYNLNIFPVFSPEGEIEGSGGMLIDFTEKHRLGQAILEAKRAAEKANQAKSAFLANISHEVRTPLNGILGMADLLLRNQLTRDQLSMVGTIKNAGYSLLTVLNDILDISKIEAGKMSLENLPFDLRDLIFDATTSLASLTKNKPVEAIVNIPPETPECLYGDPVRIRQIVLNLVSNALKFTENGEVNITVEILERSVLEERPLTNAAETGAEPLTLPPEMIKLRFSVADTGIGIPPEKRHIIFQPFEQADASTTRTHGGTGLGLAICHRLLTMMDSRLELTSQVGQGSTFWFDLALPVSTGETLPALSRLNPVRLAGRSILLVDDNDSNRHFLMEELKILGLNVVAAAGADEALRYLKLTSSSGQPFDLVITDNIMPHKSGPDLLKEMRAEPIHRSIPAILLTSADIQNVSAGRNLLSFSAVLTKPVRPAELVVAITAALDLTPSEQAERGDNDEPYPPAVSFRVLVVEDVEMNQVVAMRLLEELGHQVVVAGDGAQALAFLRERGGKNCFDFDLVLMDIQMPGLDGLETTAELRRMEAENNWPPLPVVALTAHAMKGDREKYLAAGLDDYLTKPILLNELASLLDRLTLRIKSGIAARPAPDYETDSMATEYPSTAPGTQVLDENVMKLSFGNNQDLLKKSMELFLRDAPNLLTNLNAALKTDDFRQIAALAHALKGISGYYTQAGPFELALLLHQTARKNPSPEMKTELNELSAALDRAVATLAAAMNERLKGQDEEAAA
ncbi:MAG: response regulator [Candidatus Adiutrix sp.]|jgi:PAS domain S-box-containing protein|nr:response regulator [Candidatus Adiutrix sp.]